LSDLATKPDSLLIQVAGQLGDATRETLLHYPGPVLATGRADLLDEDIREQCGIRTTGEQRPAGFYVCAGGAEDTPAYDRPYLPPHAAIRAEQGTTVHYQARQTPLITEKGRWLYWQPPDWSEPFNPFVPKYQLGSAYPHFLAARLLNDAARDAGLSHVVSADRARTIAFHLWRSDAKVYVLLGNLETGEFGDSRTPRAVTLVLSRRQLQLTGGAYHLKRIDDDQIDDDRTTIAPNRWDDGWLVYTLTVPPEGSAVFIVSEA
jgi:hypothetical protein